MFETETEKMGGGSDHNIECIYLPVIDNPTPLNAHDSRPIL